VQKNIPEIIPFSKEAGGYHYYIYVRLKCGFRFFWLFMLICFKKLYEDISQRL